VYTVWLNERNAKYDGQGIINIEKKKPWSIFPINKKRIDRQGGNI
jgi:hypothetical protein